jgi:hypothetical protein
MAGNQSIPGNLCQEEAPISVRDGTLALTASPSPVTEEDVSYEIRASYAPVPTSLVGLNPAELQVLGWLRAHRGEIVEAEQRFRIDRRAIAGAIAWEMLENVVHNPKLDLSVGVGKVHTFYANKNSIKGSIDTMWASTKGFFTGDRGEDSLAKEIEEFGYLPPQSFASRKALLTSSKGAITYIAAIMSAFADLAAQHKFDDIRCDPVILTNAYQGRTLESWQAWLKVKPKGTSFSGGNPMDVWVAAHIAFLEDGVGRPDLPESGGEPAPSMSVMPASGGAAPVASKTITVARNSSLSAIALAEYGSLDLWPLIHDLNKAKMGPNPNLVSMGTTLEIAPLSSYDPAQIAWARSQAPSWRHHR